MILHLENLEVEEQKLQFFPKMQMSCTKKVIPDAEGKHWYTRDEHGVVHRFGNSNDGKVIRYQPQLWQAFESEVLEAHPDALILSGDLSLNGEKANHLEFAEKLRKIKDAGIPVYVIPGNHDINKPNAGE